MNCTRVRHDSAHTPSQPSKSLCALINLPNNSMKYKTLLLFYRKSREKKIKESVQGNCKGWDFKLCVSRTVALTSYTWKRLKNKPVFQ